MSYTDPRKTVNFFGLTSAGAGTPDVQVEATAAILKPEGSGFIQDDDTTSGVPKATTANESPPMRERPSSDRRISCVLATPM